MGVLQAHPKDGVGMGFEIATGDVRVDDEEFEAEASAADKREIDVDPLAIGDSFESSRGGILDLEDTIYDIVHYMSDVRIDRITDIETTQRQLEASQLVASGERASLVERIGSLRLEYLKVRKDRDDTRRRLRRLESYHIRLEGAENFYVTGYDEHGSDIVEYNDLMTQQRRSIILVTVGNDPDYGHMLYGPGWEKLKRCFDFSYGKRVVLTNMLGNDLRVLVFRDDGYEINHENLPHTKVILDTVVKKETQKDPRIRHVCNWKGHFVVHEEEEVVFYQALCHHINNEGSLAIPPDFVIANDLFIFEHAKIVYGKKSYRLELHREFYIDDPSCVNDMKLVRNWRIPGKSLDEGLVPLMSNQDVLIIKEVVEDDEVKEASETGNSGKQLLSVTKNDVQTKTGPSTPPWSFESLSDSDIKRGSGNTNKMPTMRENEAEENAELFDDPDHLLEHVPFLKETVVIVYGNALLLVVDDPVVPPVIVLEEQLERPNKRRKLNPT
ncbi:hypothetical protein Tco_0012053 [Tanacetum coccineum]